MVLAGVGGDAGEVGGRGVSVRTEAERGGVGRSSLASEAMLARGRSAAGAEVCGRRLRGMGRSMAVLAGIKGDAGEGLVDGGGGGRDGAGSG